MTNTNVKVAVTGQTVVLAGKVRGWLYTTVLTDGTVYRRFVPKFNERVQEVAVEKAPIVKAPVEKALVQEVVDIPDFMKEWSKNKKEESRKQRIFKHLKEVR